MRWPDGLDIGIGLDDDRCISEIPRETREHTDTQIFLYFSISLDFNVK